MRRLPRTGSSRPPPSSRLRLYGLYKQSMEGDVERILPRPQLPPPSPTQPQQEGQAAQGTGTGSGSSPSRDRGGSALSKYASRDLRMREAQAEIEKWDAWHACKGLSQSDAKRKYIEALIETMKVYASGTQESRELVEELEFVWGQIKSSSNNSGQSGSGDDGGESPRRSGMAERRREDGESQSPEKGPLRRLSPVSRGDVIEGEDADSPPADGGMEDDKDEDVNEEFSDARDGSEEHNQLVRGRSFDGQQDDDYLVRQRKWRKRIESALTRMTAEIAALREQLSDNKAYGHAVRRRNPVWYWTKWIVWQAVRQLLVNMVLVLLFVIWGRWKGDRRAEEWVKRRLKGLKVFAEKARIGNIVKLR